jgi:hypothetical protein
MGLLYNIVVALLLAVVVRCHNHLYTNGPFGKGHLTTDVLHLSNFGRGINIFSRHLRLPSIGINELKVSSTKYFKGDTITVSWTPVSKPCEDDIIGVYFVETPVNAGAYQNVDFEFLRSGQSKSTWSMLNIRRPLEFRYYSRGPQCTGYYRFVAKSPVVQPINVNEPTQVHLALGNQNDQIYVSYVTFSNQTIPQCQYGLDPSALTFQVAGTSNTYKASDMCEGKANRTGPGAFIDPGYMHTILLTDLRPSTIYYYRVGNDQDGWSQVYNFTNRPSTADDAIHLLAYGDMGVFPIQPGAQVTINRVTQKVLSNNISGVLHIGDISYAVGSGALWESFMNQIEPTAARVPYMVGIGNHEYDHVTGGDKDPSGAPGPGGFHPPWGSYGTDSGGECAVPVVHRFHSPSNGNLVFWYSFDVGPAHIIYYSTEHDFLPTSPQYAWLEKDLSSVDRSRTPWLIVGSHRPMISSSGVDGIGDKLQQYIEPLLYKYHVDVNLFAHIHSYERTCPMYQKQCVQDGVTHVLIGMGGYQLTNSSHAPVDWSKYHDAAYGYTHMWINKTYLEFTYYHSVDDQIYDQFSLSK